MKKIVGAIFSLKNRVTCLVLSALATISAGVLWFLLQRFNNSLEFIDLAMMDIVKAESYLDWQGRLLQWMLIAAAVLALSILSVAIPQSIKKSKAKKVQES